MIRNLRTRLLLVCLFLLPILWASDGLATVEIAVETGQACGICHVDPAGGGELTREGQEYALSLAAPTPERPSAPSSAGKPLSYFVRLAAGYLHILFAMFWFGTILYVHLVLKPAYASAGLPRGEVKVGLLSLLIMAVTGGILYYYRVPSMEVLVSSRFGILLLIKIGLFLVMLVSALFVVFFIGPRLRRKTAVSRPAGADKLTRDALAQYDGRQEHPAYIAFQGKIYDVSRSRLWKNGSHLDRHRAGFDLTEALAQAPHGEDKVLAMPCVGTIAESEPSRLTPPQKVFYFMAYMNLACVFLIVLILTFWRWL